MMPVVSDSNQPPESDPSSASHRAVVRWRWHRVSLYAGSIALVLALWICGLLYTIRFHPDRFVNQLLAELPYPGSVGQVAWVNRRTLQIDDVKLGDFFYADSITVTASPVGLLRRHIAKVQITGGQVLHQGALCRDGQDQRIGARDSTGRSGGWSSATAR